MEEFECTKCHLVKEKNEFWARNDRKKGVASKCKLCSKESYDSWRRSNIIQRRRNLQEWRLLNPEKIRKLYRDSDQKRRNSTVEWVNKLKQMPCMDCKQSFEPFVMDFDHRAPFEKRYTIGFMASKRMPKAAILEEIAKCDLVCSNCHRVRTYRKKV